MSQVQVRTPDTTIGILGGGQLGRMMILEGRKMGYRFVTFDPVEDCPAAQVSDRHIVANYHDREKAAIFADQVDLVLYEFENIDPSIVELIEQKKPVPQGSQLLRIASHRLREKQALLEAGIPVTPFNSVRNLAELKEAITQLGCPAVLKTVTGGYDGKGQWMLKEESDLSELPESCFSSDQAYIMEQFVPFVRELSVMVARNAHGEVVTFPPVMNIHRNHILHMSIAPAPVNAKINDEAEQIAKQIAEKLGVVGLIGVEMFQLDDGRLLVNELAPRPHNSGHYTYDACYTSQFEQMIRAVTGLPLHSTDQIRPAIMVNLLGEHQPTFFQELSQLPKEMKIHWYGKKEAKKGRKMGHITVTAATMEEALEIVEASPIWPPLTAKEKEAMES